MPNGAVIKPALNSSPVKKRAAKAVNSNGVWEHAAAEQHSLHREAGMQGLDRVPGWQWKGALATHTMPWLPGPAAPRSAKTGASMQGLKHRVQRVSCALRARPG